MSKTKHVNARDIKRRSCQLIRNIRAKLGLTQKAMADKLGISVNTFIHWEHDGVPVRGVSGRAALERLEQLAKENQPTEQFKLEDGRVNRINQDGSLTGVRNNN